MLDCRLWRPTGSTTTILTCRISRRGFATAFLRNPSPLIPGRVQLGKCCWTRRRCIRLREDSRTILGKLGEANILDVRDDGDEILHIVDCELEPGSVKGCVVWPRRFDHMQQHTGHTCSRRCFRSGLACRQCRFTGRRPLHNRFARAGAIGGCDSGRSAGARTRSSSRTGA